MERMEGVGYFCVFLCEHVGMLAIGALPNSCHGIESLLGDSSLTCVCSLLFRFGPEMGAYSIYFSFCGWCCLPINVWLSLSDFHLFVLVVYAHIFSLSFLLLFAALCLHLQCVAAPFFRGVCLSVSVPLFFHFISFFNAKRQSSLICIQSLKTFAWFLNGYRITFELPLPTVATAH